jgi:hypothetical protein
MLREPRPFPGRATPEHTAEQDAMQTATAKGPARTPVLTALICLRLFATAMEVLMLSSDVLKAAATESARVQTLMEEKTIT